MNVLRIIRALGPADLRSVSRDSLLLMITAGSLLLALAMRFGVPLLDQFLVAAFGFDLEPYVPLLASLVVLIAPGLAGSVVGFLLLDEKDEGALTALFVTPLSLPQFLGYRLGVPIFFAFITTLVAVPVSGLLAMPWPLLLITAALASFSGGANALILASIAENKVTGLAVLKVWQGVQALPLAAFFLPPPSQWIAGIVPTFWPAVVVWRSMADQSVPVPLLIGFSVNGVWCWLLVRRYRASVP